MKLGAQNYRIGDETNVLQVSSDVRFDRSVLTGETMPLLGSIDSTDNNYLETACIGFAGTHCVSGSAVGVVVSTGDKTVFGRVSRCSYLEHINQDN